MEEVPSGFQALNKTALYMTISEAMQQENTMLHDSIDKLVANPCSVGLAQTSPVVPLGLVIGTYAALPYIHLQLEARRRLYPDVRTLVIHIWAQRFSDTGTERWHAWQKGNPVPEERRGYAPWTLMGTCRQSKYPTRLWHDSEHPVEYGRLAQEWGLPYSEEDFVDPNMGTGPGKAPPFCVNTT